LQAAIFATPPLPQQRQPMVEAIVTGQPQQTGVKLVANIIENRTHHCPWLICFPEGLQNASQGR
jgi:hypothetical protein